MKHGNYESISRLSKFQMNIKGFTIAIVTATIFVDSDSWFTMILVLVVLFSLWILDAYYLSLERSLRKKNGDHGNRRLRNKETIRNNLFTKPVAIFHISFIFIAVCAFLNAI